MSRLLSLLSILWVLLLPLFLPACTKSYPPPPKLPEPVVNQQVGAGDVIEVSIVGEERLLKTLGNMLSHAKTHRIVGDETTHLSVGSSFIYMDRDNIVIKAKKIVVDEH